MWIPRFVCPECRTSFAADPGGGDGWRMCSICGRRYECRDGIWRFLTETRAAANEPFAHQYRIVRERDGYRVGAPDYYRRLPHVDAEDPHAVEWGIRRETYQHLLHCGLLSAAAPLRVLDLGAGNGWLSHRLAEAGHDVTAVDTIVDAADGLGAIRHYPVRFPAVEASFDALPFAPAQFALVVFNGSLHYAPDVRTTLTSVWRMLTPGGTLAVMDSPMFHDDRSGRAMLAGMVRRFEADYEIEDVVRPGAGYLTFASLDGIARSLGARARFIPSGGSIGWRVRRQIGRIRLRRAPAAFGLWIAR